MVPSASGSALVAAFYKFVRIEDSRELRDSLYARAEAAALRGILLVAPEGINGTMSGSPEALRGFLEKLRQDERFGDLGHKESWAEEHPFARLRVRRKNQIVSFGARPVDPTKGVGNYVAPKDWNALIQQDDVVLIDTRNDFEVELGSFPKAVDPKTESFNEFAAWVDDSSALLAGKKVAMFCTGGIRCEKATSYLLQQGYDDVYHLHGGILQYFEDVSEDESLWKGECFIFDQRVALNQRLEPSERLLCPGCRFTVGDADQQSPHYRDGICCPRCYDTLTPKHLRKLEERQRQRQLMLQHEAERQPSEERRD
jgi:UPF0176 protein